MDDAIPLLVCDDSSMARKQLIRSLPANWPLRISQAEDGRRGLELIRQGQGRIVLLDLTMPEMNGFDVLAQIRDEGLPAEVIVISGDVQQEAIRRAKELGARAFLRKPVDAAELAGALLALGMEPAAARPGAQEPQHLLPSVSFRDAFRELSNIAMGRAAELLGRVLKVFIRLPVPNVNLLEAAELQMTLADAQGNHRVSAICQGYIGGGIAGEALLIFHDSAIADVAGLLDSELDSSSHPELLLDLAAIITGACLSGLSEQLGIQLSLGHPLLLGQHCTIDELIRLNRPRWQQTLAVEISYALEDHDIHFDLMLLFTEDSVARLQQRVEMLHDLQDHRP
ncbi:response regulator receiver [Pseudomonas saudimassiliensis]|uniref:Response regulator receiver n=1 Tax=Pseudomonas saudimassiliensis TaxID=1461581 RepID=A0A078MH36_9PSED|nr:response regulator receiver [Pseudomonas saudimassiliensis]CEF27225.1 response regulator receiver [Pseudomonas saudimassiliensis]